MKSLKTFSYKLYIKIGTQEFLVNSIKINAKNVDEANKILSKKDIPFHHFSTVESLKN